MKFWIWIKNWNSHHDLSDFIFSFNFMKFWIWIKKPEQPSWLGRLHFFPKFHEILNLNQKVGTAIMTCLTSFFSLNYQKNFEFELKSHQFQIHENAIYPYKPLICPTSYVSFVPIRVASNWSALWSRDHVIMWRCCVSLAGRTGRFLPEYGEIQN